MTKQQPNCPASEYETDCIKEDCYHYGECKLIPARPENKNKTVSSVRDVLQRPSQDGSNKRLGEIINPFAHKCKKCNGALEKKFGDYHPICNPNHFPIYNANEIRYRVNTNRMELGKRFVDADELIRFIDELTITSAIPYMKGYLDGNWLKQRLGLSAKKEG